MYMFQQQVLNYLSAVYDVCIIYFYANKIDFLLLLLLNFFESL